MAEATVQEIQEVQEESYVDRALAKLGKELEDKALSGEKRMILNRLVERCREDGGLSADVVQEHKTFAKCFSFVRDKAKAYANDGCAMIEDSTVYEWAEDYYHLDDTAEEARKKEEEKARKDREKEEKAKSGGKSKKAERKQAEEEAGAGTEEMAGEKAETVEERKKPARKEKSKKTGEMEGQMDMFSLLGMAEG